MDAVSLVTGLLRQAKTSEHELQRAAFGVFV
jgi:hypothetical protein